MPDTEKRYMVVQAFGSTVRVVHSTDDRKDAQTAMWRFGGVCAVRTKGGRILASTVARSFG